VENTCTKEKSSIRKRRLCVEKNTLGWKFLDSIWNPEHSDYYAEGNCSRNFEPWRENEKLIEEVKKAREREEEGDAMKALENRTIDSKIEMDIIEALDEIRALNARNAAITSDTLIEHHKRTYEQMQRTLEQDDEETVKNVVFKNSNKFLKRVDEDEEPITVTKPVSTSSSESFIKVLPLPEKKAINNNSKKSLIKVVPVVAKKDSTSDNNKGDSKKKKTEEKPAFSLVDYDWNCPKHTYLDFPSFPIIQLEKKKN